MFTLSDLLNLPLMQSARPEILVGDNFDTRQVRWVHTSEIFEISPLLKGGEVLFTTGLGLVGSPAGAISAYVESLAKQNVTALIMEVGRTFVHLPKEFVDAAEKHQLPLITMHRVIPFVEFTEVIHPLLIAPEVESLRRAEQAFHEMTSIMLNGGSIDAIVESTQRMIEVPLGLYSSGRQLLAGEDPRSQAAESDLVEVPVGPEPWAYLVCAGKDKDIESVSKVLETSASVVALMMAQEMTGNPGRTLAVGDFLVDTIRGHFLNPDEVESQAASLGFVLDPNQSMVAVVADITRSARNGLIAVTKAARKEFGPNLVAEIENRVVLVVQIREGQNLVDQIERLADSVDRELAKDGDGRAVRLVTGPAVFTMAGLSMTLSRAIEGAKLARRLSFPQRILTDSDLGLHDLLTRVVSDSELERFVDQQIGPLLQADARSGNRLVETLDAYLEAGRSKSEAAKHLGIRRQTMYQRIERISTLLGGLDLTSQQRLTALDLAITAWRMRTSGLTGI